MLEIVQIRRLQIDEIPKGQDFIFGMLKTLYNSERNPLYHNDIINMKEVYIDNKNNTIVGAFNGEGDLIGTISVKEFVNRFESLKELYKGEFVAEVGRCYINQDLRRKGVGSALFEEVFNFCREIGYEKIYLHTHKHLPGGFDFWVKKGFVITVEEDDKAKTIHMEKTIK